MTYAIGTITSLVAFAIFLTVSRPALGKMGQLQLQVAQAPESGRASLIAQMNAVRGRAGAASLAIALLLTLAAITMAIARYVD